MKWFKRLKLKWDLYWLNREHHKEIQKMIKDHGKRRVRSREIRPPKVFEALPNDCEWGTWIVTEPIPTVDWDEELKQLLKEEL